MILNASVSRRHLLSQSMRAAAASLALTHRSIPAAAQDARPPIRHGRGASVPPDIKSRLQLQDALSNAIEAKYSALPGLNLPTYASVSGLAAESDHPPPHFDWRDKNAVTSVKDQGVCGSCFIFASVAVYESALLLANRDLKLADVAVSEQEILDCGIAEANCIVGGWNDFVFVYLLELGAVDAESYPYNSNAPQKGIYCVSAWGQRPYMLRNWGHVTAEYLVPSVSSLKKALLVRGPLTCGVTAGRDWDSYRYPSIDWKPTNGIASEVNHEVVLVGWDDNRAVPGADKGSWTVRNSWGTGWGDQGYVYVPYNKNNIGFGAAWASAWPAASLAALATTTSQVKAISE